MQDKLIKSAIEKHNPKKKQPVLKKKQKCQKCGNLYKKSSDLKIHEFLAHKTKKDVKKYKCKDCRQYFGKKARKEHYMCTHSVCGMKFCRKSSLLKHTYAVCENHQEIQSSRSQII